MVKFKLSLEFDHIGNDRAVTIEKNKTWKDECGDGPAYPRYPAIPSTRKREGITEGGK